MLSLKVSSTAKDEKTSCGDMFPFTHWFPGSKQGPTKTSSLTVSVSQIATGLYTLPATQQKIKFQYKQYKSTDL